MSEVCPSLKSWWFHPEPFLDVMAPAWAGWLWVPSWLAWLGLQLFLWPLLPWTSFVNHEAHEESGGCLEQASMMKIWKGQVVLPWVQGFSPWRDDRPDSKWSSYPRAWLPWVMENIAKWHQSKSSISINPIVFSSTPWHHKIDSWETSILSPKNSWEDFIIIVLIIYLYI